LEDTVHEDAVEDAENELYQTLKSISAAKSKKEFYIPLIFVRVRSPQQLKKLAVIYNEFSEILTGFILPKFYIENCATYIEAIQEIKENTNPNYYYMPIFESASMIPLRTRYDYLEDIKTQLEVISDSILNIRVGGNDLSHAFGLRRPVDSTIYDVKPVASLMTDILTTFATQYVVSGPVWEYYSGEGWDTGLKREVTLDKLSGFVGKTVIHPNQIPIINELLKVSAADYEDACNILNWQPDDVQLVSASANSSRMNEYNTHVNWANRVICMAKKYGVKQPV
jgi:citrate lyase beta subunit